MDGIEIGQDNFSDALSFSMTGSLADSGGTGNVYPSNDWGFPMVERYYSNWYYPCCQVRYEKSKTDTAFAILKVLMEKGMLKIGSVGKFIGLVHDISEKL